MGFLFRAAVVASIGVMLIPADPAEIARSGGTEVSTLGALGLAKAAYDDAGGFCERKAEACRTAGGLAASFSAKARTGAKWVYGYLAPADDGPSGHPSPGTPPAAAIDPTATGSTMSIPTDRSGRPVLPRPKPTRAGTTSAAAACGAACAGSPG